MIDATVQKLAAWADHPALFVEEALGFVPDAWQVDVLEAFPRENRIAMKACKGPGKTATLAALSWNFLVTRPQAQIGATSISADNLSDGLWKEMALWQGRSTLLAKNFSWTKTRITHNGFPETWFMSARSWAKSASKEQQADALAGFHADYLMYVLDEAGGIPDGVMAAAEAGLSTGIETKIMLAGNPTHLEGPLFRACNYERKLWWVIEITGDPDDPKRSPRVNIEWARDQIAKYGREHPWVKVNVLGQFPPSSMNTLMGHEEVMAAMGLHYPVDIYSYAQKRIGIDVARFGDDRSVIFPRQGLVAFEPVVMRSARTTEIAARAAQGMHKWSNGAVEEIELFVDDTGHWGHGVIDQLLAAGYSPIGLQYHGPAIDPRYKNRRAEMWFGLAEWVKRGGALPRVPELIAELTTPKYFFNGGKLQLEEKEQIKETLGRSPDLGDALAQTFALPDGPAKGPQERVKDALQALSDLPKVQGAMEEQLGQMRGSQSNWDYDPLKEFR